MIVLRGTLKAEENGTWRWKGVWAFGALPTSDDVAIGGGEQHQPDNRTVPTTTSLATDLTTTTTTATAPADLTTNSELSKALPAVTSPRGRPRSQSAAAASAASAALVPIGKPFDYTWEKAAFPWQVLIPSANPMPETAEDQSNKEDQSAKEDEEAMKDVGESNQPENAKVTNGVEKPLPVEEKKDESTGEATSGTSNNSENQVEAEISANVPESAAQVATISVSDEPPTPDQSAETKDVAVEKNEYKQQYRQGPVAVEKNESKQHDRQGPDDSEQRDDSKRCDDHIVTFATTLPGEPSFTDASLSHPDKCPPGGSWKGFFENLPKRREKTPIQVPESFHLFFNSTPPKDARVNFDEQVAEGESKSLEQKKQQHDQPEGLLPPGRIHVRGCGTNEFGIFEILGSLDLETGTLECRRMYVAIPDLSPSYRTARRPSNDTAHPSTGARGIKSLRTSTGESNDSTRPYLTRKRQLSWKRRSSFDSEGDDDLSSGRKGTNPKKRVKLEDKPIIMPSLEATQAVSPVVNVAITEPHAASSRPKKPPSSPRPQMSKKKAVSITPNKSAFVPSSSEANLLKLPDVGDPRKARWRAAHFLYYQRHDPSTTEEGTSSKGSSPSYVVYEGEMQDSLRWGYGICLYSNGMLYEGEWKRNKEHGKGTLMTSDRGRVIYEGEWERGRMHGKGTYYYGNADLMNKKKDKKAKPDGNEASRYEGEFKENMRHGFGTYYLPDGSVYAGMWREGLMSGRGVFTWPDNSVYDGDFRDGKRNGQGLLKTSDGFSYDGMWVQNAMEGRGSAIYPNGQRYDGLFSNGRREGRGTILFTNGAVYEGRFRDDAMDGQGTMKISRAVVVPRSTEEQEDPNGEHEKDDFMIPVSFQSDMIHIHQKAGFNEGGE